MAEREHEVDSQLVSLIKEDDRNLLLRTLPLLPVAGFTDLSIGARAWVPRWRVLLLFALIGGLGSFLGSDSPPE